jgi:hypothetical protein
MSRVGMGVFLLLPVLVWGGCAREHERPSDNSSSGSNWLRCEELADCSRSAAAVACGADGFCADSRGERIAVRASEDGGRDAQVAMADGGQDAQVAMQWSGGADAQARVQCPWGTDDLLRQVDVVAPNRRNCGLYWATTAPLSLTGARACFDAAVTEQAAVQISFNRCVDCWQRTTYVTTETGEQFEILMEDDGFGDDQRTATVKSCENPIWDLESTLGLRCSGGSTLYECSEPRSGHREPAADPAIEPFKLTDLPAGGAATVLHLYVSNQSFAEPLVDISVSLTNVQVVTGDFAVEGQHNWYAFDIAVPTGTLELYALSFTPSEAINLTQQIDVPAERWAVLNYWYYPDDSEGRHFTLTMSDTPVSFD